MRVSDYQQAATPPIKSALTRRPFQYLRRTTAPISPLSFRQAFIREKRGCFCVKLWKIASFDANALITRTQIQYTQLRNGR